MKTTRAGVLVATSVAALSCGAAPTAPSAGDPPPQPANAAALNVVWTRCPTAAELASLEPLRFDFSPDILAGERVCHAADGSIDLTRTQRRVYSTLLFLRNIRFDAPLPWTPLSAWDWLLSLNPQVYFFTGDGTSKCVFCPGPRPSLNLNVGSGNYDATWSTVAGLSAVIMHEGRHAQTGGHRCGNDDYRVDDLEAFGVQYYFLIWSAEHTSAADFPVEFAPELRWRACTMRNSAFCRDKCQ